MRILVVIVQLLVSLFVTASLMPIVLVTMPAARESRVGVGIMLGMLAIAFALVSLVWPGRKRQH